MMLGYHVILMFLMFCTTAFLPFGLTVSIGGASTRVGEEGQVLDCWWRILQLKITSLSPNAFMILSHDFMLVFCRCVVVTVNCSLEYQRESPIVSNNFNYYLVTIVNELYRMFPDQQETRFHQFVYLYDSIDSFVHT